MKSFKLIIVAAIAVLGCSELAFAQSPSTPPDTQMQTGTLKPNAKGPQGEVKAFIVNGSVQSKSNLGTLTPIARGDSIPVGTTIVTGADGSALLVFSNGAAMQLKANTTVQLVQFDQAAFDESQGTFLRLTKDPSKSTTQLNLTKGTLAGQVKQLNLDAGSSFTVNTPAGSAGIRGTIPVITVTTDPVTGHVLSVTIACSEGSVTFKPTTIAGVPTQLQKNTGVDIDQGGQLKVSINQDPSTGNITSISVLGQTYTGADAQAIIDQLYVAVNQVRADQGLNPVTPPTAAPANPPNTSGTTTTPTTPTTPPTNPTISE